MPGSPGLLGQLKGPPALDEADFAAEPLRSRRAALTMPRDDAKPGGGGRRGGTALHPKDSRQGPQVGGTVVRLQTKIKLGVRLLHQL
jgi:hypothetical protein